MINHLTFHSRLLASLLCCFFLIGCGSGSARPLCYAASGRVLLDNQPVAEAKLTFHPLSGTLVPLPTAVSLAEGKFTVNTWGDNDGLPAGEYAVTVVLPQLVQQGEEKVRNGKNLLPALYADPKKTPLRCTVKAEENKLPDLVMRK